MISFFSSSLISSQFRVKVSLLFFFLFIYALISFLYMLFLDCVCYKLFFLVFHYFTSIMCCWYFLLQTYLSIRLSHRVPIFCLIPCINSCSLFFLWNPFISSWFQFNVHIFCRNVGIRIVAKIDLNPTFYTSFYSCFTNFKSIKYFELGYIDLHIEHYFCFRYVKIC